MSRAGRSWTATCILALLTGVPSAWGAGSETDFAESIRARGLDPEALVAPEELTDEIVIWATERVDTEAPPDRLLQELLGVLSSPEGLGLQYDPSFTATAAEVFASRRANCLAFTHLFIGLSRHFGLETYYLNFEDSERFRREKDLILVSGHVTAGYGVGGQRRVLEFGEVEGANAVLARRISDLTALALYYSNRSAEALRTSDEQSALELAEIAVKLGPELADAWVNLGVARRRTDDLEGAEKAYRGAVGIESDHLPAYHNLTTLLWLEGDRKTSREIMKLLDRVDNMNPFTYLEIGDISLAANRPDDARRFYRRALWLDKTLAEPKAALGILALEEGRPNKARTWLRRARQSPLEGARTLELEERLAELEQSSSDA